MATRGGCAPEQANLAWIPAALQATAVLRSFTAGETLFFRGEEPAAMFHVLEGEVRLLRPGADGTQIILQRCRLGFIAEASLGSIAYHCDAVAASPGRLLRFPLDELRNALDEDRGFRDGWIGHLAEKVRRLRAQCERLSMRGAAQRIVHYIETEGRGGVLVLHQFRNYLPFLYMSCNSSAAACFQGDTDG